MNTSLTKYFYLITQPYQLMTKVKNEAQAHVFHETVSLCTTNLTTFTPNNMQIQYIISFIHSFIYIFFTVVLTKGVLSSPLCAVLMSDCVLVCLPGQS